MKFSDIRAEPIFAEIALAFHGTARPAALLDEDTGLWGEEYRFDPLERMTWQDLAASEVYLAGHISEEFYLMSYESFRYFLPGYLIGALTGRPGDSLCLDLLEVLGAGASGSQAVRNLQLYLLETLTPAQKQAVVRWLELQLEFDRERNPGIYGGGFVTLQQKSLETWRALI